jgi:hypothetical protein
MKYESILTVLAHLSSFHFVMLSYEEHKTSEADRQEDGQM